MRRFSGTAVALYALAWSTFALGFAALFWLREGGPSWPGIFAAVRVVLPAALLGVLVVAACARVAPAALRSPATLLAHLAGAALFPAAWIASVSGVAAISRGVSTGVWSLCLPPVHVLHWHGLTGVMMYATLAAVTHAFVFTRRADELRHRAESRLFRAQLNPHFLFNTLHTLFALARSDADAGEAALDRLSRVLRHALRAGREDLEVVSLAEEWRFARDVLELEALRFGERIRWEAEISPEALPCAIPPLLLQPLVENALRHAIGPRPEGGRVEIRARLAGGSLEVRVADDGPGCRPDDTLRSTGVGLRSIRARLAALSPDPGRLEIDTAPGRGFVATLRLPARLVRS